MSPLLFHEVHGEWMKLFQDSSILRRLPSPDYKGGIAFSNRPVEVGETVRLRLLKDGESWLGFITFGFTKHNPESLKPLNNSLPEDINSSAAKRAGFWSVFADRHFYQEDDVLFFCMNSLGTVQYGVNGVTKGTFDITEQCDRIELWAMVDTNVDDMIIQLVNPPLRYRAEDGLQLQNENEELQEDEPEDALCPLRFHSTSGNRAKVSFDGCTARHLASCSLPEYSSQFFKFGKWNDEILPPLNFIRKYSNSTANGYVQTCFAVFSARTVAVDEKICLRFINGSAAILGFTNYNPDTNNEETNAHSHLEHWGVQIEASSLEDNILYYYVNSTGDICFGNNNEDLGIHFSVVDTRTHLWAILILLNDTIVQFVDPRSTQVGPSIPTKFPKLMRFHPVHGKPDAVSRDGSKAVMKKHDKDGNSTVYTYRPVGINEQISLRISINEKLYANSCLLTFGFTNHDPSLLSYEKSKNLKQPDKGKILLKGHNILFHIYVDSSGDVHFWCEGDSERRSMSAIDIRGRFWLFIKTNVPAYMYFVETTSEPPPCKYVYNLSPMEFHYIHGKNLVRQYSSVQCIRDEPSDECREGLAFSLKPIELNKKICLRILAIPDEKSSIQIGVTILAPAVPRIFQDPANRSKIFTRLLKKECCKENNNIYFYVNSFGEVLYGINGEEMGILTSGVDISRDIWALVEVSGLSTILMFTNASGIRQTIDNCSLIDQRRSVNDWMYKHKEFSTDYTETDNAMEIEECPAIDNSLRFHRIHSQNVSVSKDGFVAQLVDEEDFRSGFAFTNRPIGVDEQICLRIQNYEYESCLLVFGFTNNDPENLTEAVRGNLFKPNLIEISLPCDDNLYIRLSPSGNVYFWTDELQSKSNYFEGIGSNAPVWLLIELPNMPATMDILKPTASCQPPPGTTYNLHPLYFHSVHGSNLRIFTKMTAEVECLRPSISYHDGVAFTSRMIGFDEKVHLRILSKRNKDQNIKLGFTSHDPSSLAGPNNICVGLTDHKTWSNTLPKKFYKDNHNICFYINSSGEVYYKVNGENKGLFFEGVDVRSPLWALVEISGPVTLMFLNAFGRFRFGEYSSYSYLIDDSKVDPSIEQ